MRQASITVQVGVIRNLLHTGRIEEVPMLMKELTEAAKDVSAEENELIANLAIEIANYSSTH